MKRHFNTTKLFHVLLYVKSLISRAKLEFSSLILFNLEDMSFIRQWYAVVIRVLFFTVVGSDFIRLAYANVYYFRVLCLILLLLFLVLICICVTFASKITVVAVLIVDECHKILNFDNFIPFLVTNDSVEVLGCLAIVGEQALDHLVVKEVFLLYSKDL